MARQAVTPQGVLTIPGAYASYQVQANPSGNAVSGVMILIGEADQGPAFSQESSLAATFFGPNQVAAVQAKYGSGRLVDAARIASSAPNDPNIQGSPTGFYLLKTNVGAKASRVMTRAGLSNYGTLYDRSYGLPGNVIGTQNTESPSEVAPAVTFTYIPVPGLGSGNSALAARVNGGAEVSLTVAKQSTPTAFVGSVVSGSSSGLNSLAGLLATGGLNRGALVGFTAGVSTLAVAASGTSVVITGSANWGTQPSVGDTLIIPSNAHFGAGQDSVIKGAGSANLGLYIVTAATANTVTATKLHDDAALTVTNPVNVSATAVSTDLTDILCYSPVTVNNMTGTSRAILAAGNVGATIAGAASGPSLVLTLGTGTWNVTPQVNDVISIPSTAPSAWHASGVNGGFYTVTSATATTVSLTRLSNGNPASFSATAIAAASNLVCLRPAIDGVGKTLELYDGAQTVSITNSLYTLAGAGVTFLSTAGVPQAIGSSAELGLDMVNSNPSFSEDLGAGGDIGLQIGYAGTTCTVTVAAKTLTTAVSGGSGSNLSVALKQYKTIGALAAFINTQPGYTASAGNNLIAQKPLMASFTAANGSVTTQTVLDQGTYNCGSKYGAQVARIKFDAYDFWSTLASGSALLQLGNPSLPAAAGLPEAEALQYLSGGTVGSTANADVVAALLKAQTLKANAVVALFSADAATDIAADLTDSGSTYDIASINAAVKSHVLAMSTFKARRARQGWASFAGSFAGAKAAAAAMASFRMTMVFENFTATASDGSLRVMQPWAGSVFAAAMQMAGFYKSILKKKINTPGVSSVDASFDANDPDQVEDALNAGLLPARAADDGGFEWVSDQTTYAVDANFVFNSAQTVYAADLVSLTTAQRMERALVGQSLADVSATSAAGIFSSIMLDLKRLKLIAASDDAPAGWKNLVINVVGDTMYVSAEVKVTETLAFVPIAFTVSQIVQTATA